MAFLDLCLNLNLPLCLNLNLNLNLPLCLNLNLNLNLLYKNFPPSSEISSEKSLSLRS